MNSTPNYNFKDNIKLCTVDAIDRELRRVEDKVDSVAQSLRCGNGKPSCGGGHWKPNCDCTCEEELRDIRDKLGDRYTKEEIDELLAENACACDSYTKVEVDELLADKAASICRSHTLYLYVDKAGSDDDGDGSQQAPYSTIRRALCETDRYVNVCKFITIAPGDYQDEGDLNLRAKGSVHLQGDEEHPEAVKLSGQYIQDCFLVMRGISFLPNPGREPDPDVIVNTLFINRCYVDMAACSVQGYSTQSGCGILLRNCTGVVSGNRIDSAKYALDSYLGSHILAGHNTGSGNEVAYFADRATLIYWGVVPDAATKELTNGGGQIYK